MEYVSVLAGAPFSDRPRCTDPTLAALARLVNDASSDAGRHRLADFAATLAESPRRQPLATAELICAVLTVAYDSTGRPARLVRHLHRSRRRVERVSGTGKLSALARRLDLLHRHGPGRRRMTAAVVAITGLPEQERDAVLRSLLDTAITADSSVDVPVPPSGARNHTPSSQPA